MDLAAPFARIRTAGLFPDYASILTRICGGGTLAPDEHVPSRIVDAACAHGVSGQLLTAALDGRVVLAQPDRHALEAGHARLSVTAAMLRAELPDVVSRVDRAVGVAPLVLKGPAVADRHYTASGHRLFADLDLLVPRSGVCAALDALRGAGYVPQPARWPATVERHAHTVELVRDRGIHRLLVELHWRVSDDPVASGLDHAAMYPHARPFSTGAGLVPGPAEELVVLSIHLLHHGSVRLIWLLDVELAARAASTQEWARAFDVADEHGLGWVLHDALDRAGQCVGESGDSAGSARPRPRPRRPPEGWGPLRVAAAVGPGRLGWHVGHLATLGWTDRAAYLRTGTAGVIRRSLEPGHRP